MYRLMMRCLSLVGPALSLLTGCASEQQSSGLPFPLVVASSPYPIAVTFDRFEWNERCVPVAVFEVANISDRPVLCHWSPTYSFAYCRDGEWRTLDYHSFCVDSRVRRFMLMSGEKSEFWAFTNGAEALQVGLWFTSLVENITSAWVFSERVITVPVAGAQ
jgi:hypothetical protein